MARAVNGMMTDTGKRRMRRSLANRTVAPHLGMVQRTGTTNMGMARRRPLSDTQRAYISAAHKPNQRIGIKPIKPAKPMFAKKVR